MGLFHNRKNGVHSIVSEPLQKYWLFFKNPLYHGRYTNGSALEKQITTQNDLGSWFDSAPQCIKRDKNITIKLLYSQNQPIIAKRFSSKNVFYHLKVWLKQERVFRLFNMSRHFMALGVPIAIPLGYALEGNGIWRTVSYFYCQYLKGTSDLQHLSEKRTDFQEWLENKKITVHFAHILATLHNNGLCHGDTKWKNIMADQDSGQLWLVDLDGATRAHLPMSRAMCKDLSRFIVDMIEYPLPGHFIEDFRNQYSQRRNLKNDFVQEKIEPIIQKILKRHQKMTGIISNS